MMYRFECFAMRSVYTFNLVAHMTITVFFRKLRRSAICRPPDLRTELILFVGRPVVGNLTYVKKQIAQFLIYLHIFYAQDFRHGSFLVQNVYCGIITRRRSKHTAHSQHSRNPNPEP
jgi:hypothetical protein